MYVKALLVYDGVEGVFGVTVKMRGGSGASKKSSSDGEPEIGVSVENFVRPLSSGAGNLLPTRPRKVPG